VDWRRFFGVIQYRLNQTETENKKAAADSGFFSARQRQINFPL